MHIAHDVHDRVRTMHTYNAERGLEQFQKADDSSNRSQLLGTRTCIKLQPKVTMTVAQRKQEGDHSDRLHKMLPRAAVSEACYCTRASVAAIFRFRSRGYTAMSSTPTNIGFIKYMYIWS